MQPIMKIAAAALAVLALAGCTADRYDRYERGYEPYMPEERFPIDVVKGKVKLRLQVVSGKLDARERLALRHFADGAATFETSKVYVVRPAGSARAELMAAAITRELIANGVARERIVHRTGGASGEISLVYSRKFAVTKECGDWSRSATETSMNRPMKDFGCSVQHNMAAQIDNPEDLQRPRPMDNPDAENRNTMMKLYRERKDYSSENPGGQKTSVNDGLGAVN